MCHFLQLHYLTVYPPSNPNRDDQGAPKSASFGGTPRLRLSSQAIKRAARLSPVMQTALEGHLGARTQRIGEVVRDTLAAEGVDGAKAEAAGKEIAVIFGKFDAEAEKKGHIRSRQLAFVSPDERAAALALARQIAAGEKPEIDKKTILRTADGAADIAMFGRMLADSPDYNREAAVQVSHALTTHRALAEDDYYSAADDLKKPTEDAGAGFIGSAGFGSGVYYLYACVDVGLLIENLGGDTALAACATEALAEALATATPSGKRNSYAHQTRAAYIRAESGAQQPRSLAGAFLNALAGEDVLNASVARLEAEAANMNAAYEDCYDAVAVMNVSAGQGSLAEIRAFARASVEQGAT
ncbi:MAG: type I-E CRISPR-associated protein Cas7/Cse4/CasC [Rhodobacteraceae bacterium]|nr:type I-E CRISPR-associated protein Cas7/Cse4/CasC [Paracoccaceae bacterium]